MRLFVQRSVDVALPVTLAFDVFAEAIVEVRSVVDPVLLVAARLELDQVVPAHGVTLRDLLQEQPIDRLPALRSAASGALHLRLLRSAGIADRSITLDLGLVSTVRMRLSQHGRI